MSDVTPPDFKDTFAALTNASFFPKEDSDNAETEIHIRHLNQMVTRWKSYLEQGVFTLSAPVDTPLGGNGKSKNAEFWTTAKAYWNMEVEAPETYAHLAKSDLVIFKVSLFGLCE